VQVPAKNATASISADMVPTESSSAAQSVTVGAAIVPAKVPAGNSAILAIRIRIAIGWHIGAIGPPDAAGTLTQLDLQLPPGLAAEGDWLVPPPQRCAGPSGTTLGYQGDLLLQRRLRIAPGQPPGLLTPSCTVTYQACNDQQCERPEPTIVQSTLEVVPR
jgi:DsbC/DsbD-like thiol-disulfide interchange protein